MKRYDGKIVWITGGGSGLGRALANELASQGATIAVSGRRRDRLEKTVYEINQHGQLALPVPCDVSNQQEVEEAVRTIINQFEKIDIVIANAGFGVTGPFESLSINDWKRQFNVNLFGVISTCLASIPELRKTRGKLILMGSVAAYGTTPYSSPYFASKFALRSLAQSLSLELKPKGIDTLFVAPGFVDTEIFQVNNEGKLLENSENPKPSHHFLWPANKAAKAIAKAILGNKREFIFTWHGKFFVFLSKYFPSVLHFFLKHFYLKAHSLPKKQKAQLKKKN